VTLKQLHGCPLFVFVTYVLDEGTLVLEGVTLAQVVELVVEVLVDLAAGAILDQKATEDAETTHP